MRDVRGICGIADALAGILVVSLCVAPAARAGCDPAKDPICSKLTQGQSQMKAGEAPKRSNDALVLDTGPNKPQAPRPIVYDNPPQPPDPAHNGGGSQPHTH